MIKNISLLLCLIAISISNISYGASFSGIGFLTSPYSQAWDVSADGSVVVGRSTENGGDARAFRWDAVNGMQDLGLIGSNAVAYAVSGDGSTVAGHSQSQAFRWTSDTGMNGLGYLPLGPLQGTSISLGTGVSADGSVVVGFGNSSKYVSGYEVFTWTQDTGMVGLGINGRAEDVSSDGSVIVGGGTGQAFRWVNNDLTGLGVLSGYSVSNAYAVSGDGNVVVGYSGATGTTEAFRWEDGSMLGLGDLAGGGVYSSALDVSGDGSLVVGYSEVNSRNDAFIWDADNGMQSLRSVLSNTYGLNLPGWTLHEATGISEDGSTIIGWGINPDGNTEAWVANISAVPIPPALYLFGSGLLGLIGLAKRKRATS